MRVKLQLVLSNDDGREETVTDIVSWNKDSHRIEHLGLTLAESKQLLTRIQKKLLQQQIERYLETRSQCRIAVPRSRPRTIRTARSAPCLARSSCPVHAWCTAPAGGERPLSFRPLSALLTASVAPELLFIESKWASLASYGLTVKALKDFLPLDAALAINTVRHDTLKVAERLEAALGEEQ